MNETEKKAGYTLSEDGDTFFIIRENEYTRNST